jgi:hypothetical protein
VTSFEVQKMSVPSHGMKPFVRKSLITVMYITIPVLSVSDVLIT